MKLRLPSRAPGFPGNMCQPRWGSPKFLVTQVSVQEGFQLYALEGVICLSYTDSGCWLGLKDSHGHPEVGHRGLTAVGVETCVPFPVFQMVMLLLENMAGDGRVGPEGPWSLLLFHLSMRSDTAQNLSGRFQLASGSWVPMSCRDPQLKVVTSQVWVWGPGLGFLFSSASCFRHLGFTQPFC